MRHESGRVSVTASSNEMTRETGPAAPWTAATCSYCPGPPTKATVAPASRMMCSAWCAVFVA